MSTLVSDIKELMKEYVESPNSNLETLHNRVIDTICNNIKNNAEINISFTGSNGTSSIVREEKISFTSYIVESNIPSSLDDWSVNLTNALKTMKVVQSKGYVPDGCNPCVNKLQLSMNAELSLEGAWSSIYNQLSQHFSKIKGLTYPCKYGVYIGTLTILSIKY